jgi:alpha-aminoadipic semialdehyde synthase
MGRNLRLQVIGDISVDINGGIEPTMKVTTPDHPSYVYQPQSDTITDDLSEEGIAIMAVDNLPCELPKDSSEEFSTALYPFIPAIVQEDYTQSFEDLRLPSEIKNAIILHKGRLTSSYEYINNYL